MNDQLRQAAMQQALEALEGELLKMLDKPVDEQYRVRYAYLLRVITALREALAQPVQPVQEPTPWRDMVVVSLVREGINKHRARELADHFAAQPVQEPVGEVVEIGDHGFRCEFSQHLAVGAKLYTAPPLPERQPLTDKQILADETLRYYFGQNGGAGPVSKQGRRVVDAIEAAHGIKEQS